MYILEDVVNENIFAMYQIDKFSPCYYYSGGECVIEAMAGFFGEIS